MTQPTTAVIASGESRGDLTSPEFTSQLLDAIEDDVDVEDYLTGRAAGATHDELLAANADGVVLADYASARQAGATHDEIYAVKGGGSGSSRLAFHAHFRKEGVTHAEAMSALATHSDRTSYLGARRAGATHAEVMEAEQVGMAATTYAIARGDGLTHEELVGTHQAAISLDYYRELRQAGVTAEEMRNAAAKFGRGEQALFDYLLIRACEVGHDDAMDGVVRLEGNNPNGYVEAVMAGATHAEIVVAMGQRIDLTDYASARASGYSHVNALVEASYWEQETPLPLVGESVRYGPLHGDRVLSGEQGVRRAGQ
jgi:hypothetical protein